MSPTDHDRSPSRLDRRRFLTGTATAAATIPLVSEARADARSAPQAVQDPHAPLSYTLRINGQDHQVALDARTTLLDALRENIGLTGSKKGCDHGQCGACTVHVDGKRVLACLTLAATLPGRSITTIEGLGSPDGQLHPMQQAFIDHDGFQCGYCTPGQIMSAVACVTEGRAGSRGEIREYMSGNLCRCAAYPNIVTAIEQARSQMKGA